MRLVHARPFNTRSRSVTPNGTHTMQKMLVAKFGKRGSGRAAFACDRHSCTSPHTRDLWLCMCCGEINCLGRGTSPDDQCFGTHALKHFSQRCMLALNCRDSHIYCAECQMYVYPRELGGSEASEKALTPAVEEWLQGKGTDILCSLSPSLSLYPLPASPFLHFSLLPSPKSLGGPGCGGASVLALWTCVDQAYVV